VFDTFFVGKRVFMTGHTGFKGSWLTLWLSMLGAQVFGYSDLPPSDPFMFKLISLDDEFTGTRGDIADLDHITQAMNACSPDLVIHMAAQSLVRRSYIEPVQTFRTNVLGTVNVMEAVRRTPSVKALINVTSDKCYDNQEAGRAFKETDPMGGSDPYSASKGCAELVARSWQSSFMKDDGPILLSVRAGNVIGGGDFAKDRLVPDMARAFSRSDAVHIRSPKAVRPWQLVLEPLSGYLTLAVKALEGDRSFAGGWNFGPVSEGTKSVGSVVEGFAQRWGADATVLLDSAPRPHEATLLRLDCTKAEEKLGWYPRTDFDTTMDWTVEWYKAWAEGTADLRALTEDQIRRFEAL
jgi:CDP-glucose 4,6-dehydratase